MALPNGSSFSAAVAWACISNLGFGLMNYLLKAAGEASSDRGICIGLMWLSCGYVAIFVLYSNWGLSFFEQPRVDDTPLKLEAFTTNKGACEKSEIFRNMDRNRWLGVTICISGGLFGGLAQFFSMCAYKVDPVDAGPLSALTTGDVVLFAIFAHHFYGDVLNCKQWLSMLLLVWSLILMAHQDGSHVLSQQDGGAGQHIFSMLLACLAMVAFFAVNAAIRISVSYKITDLGGFVLRGLTAGSMGMGVLVVKLLCGEFQSFLVSVGKGDWNALILPNMCGLCQALGIYALGRAFMHPRTSILLAIVGCNPIVVLILGMLIDGDFPAIWQISGMALAVVSVILISILADVKDLDDGSDLPSVPVRRSHSGSYA